LSTLAATGRICSLNISAPSFLDRRERSEAAAASNVVVSSVLI
jgi:hypothetical protein